MYPVSAAYKTAIGQNVRDVKIAGTITLKDDTIINITDEDIVQGSLYVTEQCVAGEDIEVGNVYASEMGLSLSTPIANPYSLDGARIHIYFGINVGSLWEYVPLGYFYVTEIQRKANNVNLTALDGMLLFDVEVGDPGSSSPRNFIVHACQRAGVTLGTSVFEIDTFANATLLFAAPDASKIKTCRDLLMWACQIMGAFARMNRSGELEIVPIKARPSVKTINKAERFNSDVSDFAVKITKVSMQVGETVYSRGTDGMTMVLEENPLMTGLSETQINAVLDNLLAQITTAVYVPFNSNFIGDPALQPGDFVTLSDTSVLGGGDVASIITHSTWRYRGPHNIKGAGKHGLVRGVQNQQMKAVSSIVAIARAAQDLALAANQSTQLIKDAIGGHVLIRQSPDETNEILIMDHPDPDQAVKIWRWNMGGLGYSDNCVGADNPDREYEIAMTMDGAINANFIKTGQLDAGVVRIGPQTTFAPGYDPTQISSASMGVDSDCVGLWHFDGSLNSHKGVAAIGDENFDTGCFGQAVKVEEGATNLVANPFFSSLDGWNAYTNGVISLVPKIQYGSNACKLALTANGATRLYTTNAVTLKAGKKYVGSALINLSGGLALSSLFILTNDGIGIQSGTLISDTNLGNGLHLIEYLFEPTEDKVGNLGIFTSSGTSGQYMVIDAMQLEEGTTSTPFVDGTRLGVLKAPTTGLSPSQGTISLRAKNLSASANGSVLIDLPKSDNTQGLVVGISSTTGHEGEVFISDSDKVFSYFADDCSSTSGWTAGGEGTPASDGNSFYASSYGTGDTLHGPSLTKALELAANDFTCVLDVRFVATNGLGNLRISLLDSSYNEVAYIQLIDAWAGDLRTQLTAYAGGTLIYDSGPGTVYSDYSGTFKIVRSGSTWTFYAGSTLLGTLNSGVTTQISHVKLLFQQYQTYEVGTMKVNSVDITNIEKQATIAYGPNKSTLTAWDSISLAWKPERLSLVVNDEEACYIKNPSLPASLGSHIFIGTDRNGANAINTLVDELRIDKVYREPNIRTGWHKTGVPFYTSEDMKQWPGYLKLETDGIKVYDSSDALRVLLGSWLRDAVRKYGLKIIGGEIYSTSIQTGQEGDAMYIALEPPNKLVVYSPQTLGSPTPVKMFEIAAHHMAERAGMTWYDADGLYYGVLVGEATNHGMNLSSVRGKLSLDGLDGIDLSGDTAVIGEITATGGKPASQPTENYGIRKIYAVESPELKYYDSGVANLQNGEATIYIDPIFLECIEPDTELTPWQIWVECYGENSVYVSEVGASYFKVKERNEGASNNKVVWRLEATRKNYAGIRLMEVV